MYSVNKNIIHNGKSYSAGQPIDKSDGNFETFMKAGHLDGAAKAKPQEEPEPELDDKTQPSIPMEEDEEQEEPEPEKKKRKKSRR